MTWVVDSSIAVKWVIPEVLSEKADRVRSRDDALLAPDLLLIEAANALWRKSERKEISAGEADRALELLIESGLDLRPTAPLLRRAMALARSLNHPVYDCVYLVLAEQERATLVTADSRLLDRVARRTLKVRVVDLATL
jgi:predicted nucleic acid-binding protein